MSAGAGKEEEVFESTAMVRTLPLHSVVRVIARVAGTKEFECFGAPSWSALLEDAWGSLPAFGFSAQPEIGSTIVVVGVVTGWAEAALEDLELVEERVREVGFMDRVELVVNEWALASEAFGPSGEA